MGTPADSLPPLFGQYRVVRLLGRGGMGSVYEAIHTQIGRRAAIKVLSPNLADNPRLKSRFFNEARAVNIVSHPSLVNISDFGEQDGIPFIVMEYLEGETLHQRISSFSGQPMAVNTAMHIVRQIASGLDAAHNKGIIHRDLKPQNIMLVPDPETPDGERVKILDFGIAKLLEPGSTEQNLTRTNALLGTPLYMAPEQCRNARDVTDRSDIYSLGVLAYELVSGVQPFYGKNDMEIILLHSSHMPDRLRKRLPHVPPELDDLVMSMLRKAPTERPTARQVAQNLSYLLKLPAISGQLPALVPSMIPRDFRPMMHKNIADAPTAFEKPLPADAPEPTLLKLSGPERGANPAASHAATAVLTSLRSMNSAATAPLTSVRSLLPQAQLGTSEKAIQKQPAASKMPLILGLLFLLLLLGGVAFYFLRGL